MRHVFSRRRVGAYLRALESHTQSMIVRLRAMHAKIAVHAHPSWITLRNRSIAFYAVMQRMTRQYVLVPLRKHILSHPRRVAVALLLCGMIMGGGVKAWTWSHVVTGYDDYRIVRDAARIDFTSRD